MEQELLYAHDPSTTDAERIQNIIESKYTPADLNKIVEECTHLEKDEQRQLLKLLQKFEQLFDGTLGTWKTDPVDLELINPNVKPFHAKPYPVPYSQEKRLKEELVEECTHLEKDEQRAETAVEITKKIRTAIRWNFRNMEN
jgi:hypothetical protein